MVEGATKSGDPTPIKAIVEAENLKEVESRLQINPSSTTLLR